MAWTTPRTWVAGELVTATMLNAHLRDNLNYLYGGDTGSWTPSVTFDTPGNLSIAYTTRYGVYQKFSKIVVAHCYIATSTFTFTTASGGMRITGLPFPAAATQDVGGGGLIWRGITKASYTHMTPVIQGGTSSMYINASGSGQNPGTVSTGDTPSGGTLVLAFTMTYATPT